MTVSGAPNRSATLRSFTALTNAEVASNSFVLNNAHESKVNLLITFVQGSLTNGIVKVQVAMDEAFANPVELRAPDGSSLTQTFTQNEDLSIPIDCAGWRYLRITGQGTDDVTGSFLGVLVRYLLHHSQDKYK